MTVQNIALDAVELDDFIGRANHAHQVMIRAQSVSVRLAQVEKAGKAAAPKRTEKLRVALHCYPICVRRLLNHVNGQ